MIPQNVKLILKTLNDAGYEAYVVGGAVRDYLLGRTPKDWDITTSATPTQTKALFNKTIDTGLKHGTITAMLDGEGFEITTYRLDGKYSDMRHPDKIEFTTSLEEDLKRRDLTINAMAMDINENVIDIFGGKKDIEEKNIRAVGNAKDRILEDPLRMMRAIRFSAQLGFTLDSSLYNAIKENSSLINNISKERIHDEFTKTLMSNYPEKFIDFYYLGITKYVLPEFDKLVGCKDNNIDIADRTMKCIKDIEKDKILRWTMLLNEFGKPIVKTTTKEGDFFFGYVNNSVDVADQILTRLKFSNKEKNEILNLIKEHELNLENEVDARILLSQYGSEFFDSLNKIVYSIAKINETFTDEKLIDYVDNQFDLIEKAKNTITAYSIKDLKINGNTLMDIGFKDKEVGAELNKLFSKVTINPEINTENTLFELASKDYKDNLTL